MTKTLFADIDGNIGNSQGKNNKSIREYRWITFVIEIFLLDIQRKRHHWINIVKCFVHLQNLNISRWVARLLHLIVLRHLVELNQK